MKTQRRVLLSLLWIQICCELRTSQGEPEGTSTSQLNLERKKVGGDDGRRERTRVSWAVSTVRMEIKGKYPPFGNRQSLFRGPYLCLFLSFSTGLRVQMKVEQSPGFLSLHEGRNSSLICNYSISIRNVQWFQQNPDGRIIFLFYIASGTQQKGNLKSTINSKERYSQLYLRDSQPEDSATYFCAVDAQCSADTCSLYAKPELRTQPPEWEQMHNGIRIEISLSCIS